MPTSHNTLPTDTESSHPEAHQAAGADPLRGPGNRTAIAAKGLLTLARLLGRQAAAEAFQQAVTQAQATPKD